MNTRTYQESGDGFRLVAKRSGYSSASYEVTAPPKKRMDQYGVRALEQAIVRAKSAMGES